MVEAIKEASEVIYDEDNDIFVRKYNDNYPYNGFSNNEFINRILTEFSVEYITMNLEDKEYKVQKTIEDRIIYKLYTCQQEDILKEFILNSSINYNKFTNEEKIVVENIKNLDILQPTILVFMIFMIHKFEFYDKKLYPKGIYSLIK